MSSYVISIKDYLGNGRHFQLDLRNKSTVSTRWLRFLHLLILWLPSIEALVHSTLPHSECNQNSRLGADNLTPGFLQPPDDQHLINTIRTPSEDPEQGS